MSVKISHSLLGDTDVEEIVLQDDHAKRFGSRLRE